MNIELLTDNEVAQLRDLISLSKNIAIVCHMNADGDALGSTLAWAEYLNMSGKNATVIVPDMYPDYLQWLPGAQQSIRFDKKKDEAKKVISEADLICCMDLNNLSRTGTELQQVTEQSTAKFLPRPRDREPATNIIPYNVEHVRDSIQTDMAARRI